MYGVVWFDCVFWFFEYEVIVVWCDVDFVVCGDC